MVKESPEENYHWRVEDKREVEEDGEEERVVRYNLCFAL